MEGNLSVDKLIEDLAILLQLKEWFKRSGAITIGLTLLKKDANSYFIQYLG